MEIKDYNEENFQYYYSREERLRLKRKKDDEKRKRRASFFFPPTFCFSAVLINLLFVLLIIFIFQAFILPFFQNNHLAYKASIKEMFFKDTLMIEVKLKSCAQKSDSYLVWTQNSLGKSKPWSGKLAVGKQETLYFSLPKDQKSDYTVWIKKDNEPAVSLSRRLP